MAVFVQLSAQLMEEFLLLAGSATGTSPSTVSEQAVSGTDKRFGDACVAFYFISGALLMKLKRLFKDSSECTKV
jgi:hypothetical protein